MQIRLTVVDPLGPPDRARGRTASCDVLVTAPAGTALSAVASALASAVSGDGMPSERGREPGGPVVLYAGAERLDDRRCTLGEPPLIDGAVLALGAPAEPEPHPELDDAPTQLHVTAGPDAGGVHLLHGGEIRIGRSADADVPLDDPDVSRLHCAVTVAGDGRVSVADLGSTNGTLLDGVRVTGRPVPFPPGALLRVGESALRLTPAGGPGARVPTAPDGEGHVRVPRADEAGRDASDAPRGPAAPAGRLPHARGGDAAQVPGQISMVPGQAGAPRIESRPPSPHDPAPDDTHAGRTGTAFVPGPPGSHHQGPDGAPARGATPTRGATPARGTDGRGTDGRGTDRRGTDGWETGGRGTDRRGTDGWETDGRGTDRRGTDGWGTDPTAPGPRSAEGHGPAAHDTTARDMAPRGRDTWSGDSRDRDARERDGRGVDSWDRDARDARERDTRGADSRGVDGRSRDARDSRERDGRGADAQGADSQNRDARDPRERDARGVGGRGADSRNRDTRDPRDQDALGRDARSRRVSDGASGRRSPGEGSWPAHASARDGGDPAGARARETREAPPGPRSPDDFPDERGRRRGVAPQGGDVPGGARRRGGISGWARRLAGGRTESDPYDGDGDGDEGDGRYGFDDPAVPSAGPGGSDPFPEIWPDPATLLLTALGPGPRLWERDLGHPEALTVRLGTADRTAPDGGLLPGVPVTADLREAGALGLAGPRARLAGLARAVLAQLAALHAPESLEIVLISVDRARPEAERTAEWSWLGWLPHLRPTRGQDCRLLLAYDREQAMARADELLRRLDDRLEHPAPAELSGPRTVLVVDGDPGGAAVRDAVARLAYDGPTAGVHVVCLAETEPASPASPVTDTYEAACAAAPTFRECGAVALLSGDVATALRLVRVARAGREPGATPVGTGTIAAVDAVSAAWSERFARALAPLRHDGAASGGSQPRVSLPLPQAARLLDELGLARATPASLMARWADAADDPESVGGRAWAVLGAGPRGAVTADLVADGPHLLIEGPAGSGRTELLRALVASLAAAERPDRLSVVLVDGRDGAGAAGGHGEGLRVCTDVPHVTTHLAANDPVRMREFAQSLSAELKRRAELVGRGDFASRHAGREVTGREASGRVVSPRDPSGGAADLESGSSPTLRLRPAASRQQPRTAPSLPRLVVVVDDLDALVSPALGSLGRPAAGSVMRALEAVAREGERLGVHLVAATGPGGRTAETEPARLATLRVELDAPGTGPDEPAPGRGRLVLPDGRSTPFQGGRVTGRIPRTATLRPTVVPLDWPRMGDPPTRRPVRELGNGPTDLALLASALERAAKQVAATEVPSLL